MWPTEWQFQISPQKTVKQHSENADCYFNYGLTKNQFSFEAIFFHERQKNDKKLGQMGQKSLKFEILKSVKVISCFFTKHWAMYG